MANIPIDKKQRPSESTATIWLKNISKSTELTKLTAKANPWEVLSPVAIAPAGGAADEAAPLEPGERLGMAAEGRTAPLRLRVRPKEEHDA